MKVKINFNELESLAKDMIVVSCLDGGEKIITLKIPTSLEVEAEPLPNGTAEAVEDWPKDGDTYYFPTSFYLEENDKYSVRTFYNEIFDNYRKNIGACFKTKEEAIAKSKEIEAWLLESKK